MILTPSMVELATRMKQHAETGTWNGLSRTTTTPYYRQAFQLHKSGVSIGYTREAGYHSSGWFKNPDYERCYHMSLAFRDPDTHEPIPFDFQRAEGWVKLFFGERARYIWEESAAQKDLGIEVRHYRVFCDAKWKPIIPRGEVYNRDLTKQGWKSYSEQHWEQFKP